MSTYDDPITALYTVATDYELGLLDDLLMRAGLIWICPVTPWTNRMGEPCGECGRTMDEAIDTVTAHGTHRIESRLIPPPDRAGAR